ncbi:MAG TPA: Gfo/Idh/MocA family oxidoreductase [Roseiarcus sp.]|nr:Gfo/Idh/MocA family oxidoreductase [Roseiarcus sp.]
MKIGVIGCGYVFDHYMATWARHPGLALKGVADRNRARRDVVAEAYKLKAYASNEELLADPEIAIVVNLTSIDSHVEVTRAALLAGKHVYSEKPLAPDIAEARALIELAESLGLRLSCAPSNAMSDTTQTMWKAVRDGAVGDVRIVYAEFDDNVIYRMVPEIWRSRTGAPWPYLHEYEWGCTYEHVGYHLTWLCAIFGPVESVTAFSKQVLPDKTNLELNPPDTPDFSVACLNFRSGVVARVTCSIGVPYDHRMRIVGNLGMLTADTYRDYRCPVYLERFSQLTLNARKAMSVRVNSLLQGLLGVGGRKIELLRNPPPGASGRAGLPRVRWWSPRGLLRAAARRELGQQDKAIGVAELADALQSGRPSFPPHDFTMHLTELTIAIQNAGSDGSSIRLNTSFAPIEPRPETLASKLDYAMVKAPSWIGRAIERRILRMHQH